MFTPRSVRYLGLVGSVLTALCAYLGGAELLRGNAYNVVDLLRGDLGVLLPVSWVAGTALLITAWWHGRRVVPSTRWALVTAGLWALPLLPFLPLGSEDVYSYACQGYVQLAGGDPYATNAQAFGCPWLGSVSEAWRDSPAPYGPLFLLLSAAAVHAGGTLIGTVAVFRLIAVVGVAMIAAGVPALARRAGVAPAKATWTVLACPLVLIHLVSGGHNDAVMIGLLVAGLALVAGRRSAPDSPQSGAPSLPRTAPLLPRTAALLLGGALLGLAVGVKATAVVVLPFAVLAAVPKGASLRALWRPGVAIGGGAVGALAVLSLLSGRGVGWAYGLLRSGDTIEWTSPSTAVGMTVGRFLAVFGVHVDALPATRLIATVLLVPALVALWWWARRGEALLGAGLALALTVVLAPVFHPWYALWPLAVLAATWTRNEAIFTRWVLVPCAVAATLTIPDGYNWALATKTQGSWLMTAALVALAVWLIRRSRAQRRAAGEATYLAPERADLH
ncbi:alpha-1,6-mannosyltransferase [Krasilnikovia cinnamomea]|uniref:Alpha-1,6-mannosyltransferase n=1 Tax=Krasilnikovia cinnamomea TaxID=349313 RepID=A0A4Q7ZQZ9_9ACTN|nr:polyprenol phosphomannose-dependent alpha 1,6 mannosyltransferase MptB [Krasilnikovia cinnamomea]RZU52819.1 alpha-1,6-mannosyltransferase [Krasilnikovia cinnamomea]